MVPYLILDVQLREDFHFQWLNLNLFVIQSKFFKCLLLSFMYSTKKKEKKTPVKNRYEKLFLINTLGHIFTDFS